MFSQMIQRFGNSSTVALRECIQEGALAICEVVLQKQLLRFLADR